MSLRMAQINSEQDWCVFCLAPKQDEVILPCKHSFCLECMEDFCRIVYQNRRCPVCRKHFTNYMNKYGRPYIVIVDTDEDYATSESESN